MTVRKIADYALRALIAAVLLQTLWFKFRAAPESVMIFSALHAEPWGRIAAGVTELIAAVLLVVPQTVVFGALLTICSMLGAVAAHVFVIGISVQNDGGLLFGLALLLFFGALALLVLRKTELAQRLQQIRSTAPQ